MTDAQTQAESMKIQQVAHRKRMWEATRPGRGMRIRSL